MEATSWKPSPAYFAAAPIEVVSGSGVGRGVDRRIGTEPLFLLLGVFTGLAASIYSMYRSLMADQRREAEARTGEGTR